MEWSLVVLASPFPFCAPLLLAGATPGVLQPRVTLAGDATLDSDCARRGSVCTSPCPVWFCITRSRQELNSSYMSKRYLQFCTDNLTLTLTRVLHRTTPGLDWYCRGKLLSRDTRHLTRDKKKTSQLRGARCTEHKRLDSTRQGLTQGSIHARFSS